MALRRKVGVTRQDFKRIALSFQGAEEGSHTGGVDFRIGGRIFATLASQAQGFGNLALTPEEQATLVRGIAGCSCASPVAGAGWG